ncbi:hypothetical protein F5Y14DRAFT_336496 [Nemania sp. NC0429]|nr:hypothetical protein F5Y14DRAFT_336496 [Nemania sp. NC0429]
MNSAALDFKGLSGGHQSPAKSPLGGLYNDPRTSSTQSLTPSLPAYEEVERRTLLIVYIHGFMGNDTSFQSFPAHVHRYLKLALSDSHVVHSKIYPRYKTYKSIEVARDNFSAWLEPLESPKTDVVLVGHSMGGLLAADIVLKPPTHQHQYRGGYFKHRILGVVNLDAPLLGMHPGIIVSGISSLFRKTETPKAPGESSTPASPGPASPGALGLPSPNVSMYSMPSTISETPYFPPPPVSGTPYFPPPPPAPFMRPALTNDPTFNPNFPNDVRVQERTWWGNVVHFVKKHNSEGLINAAANHVMSHMEFGGSMFDINSLTSRYENVRKLEEVDDFKQVGVPGVPRQVRFIQYYTICNGFPKKPKQEDLEPALESALESAPEPNEKPSIPSNANLEKGPSLVSFDGPGFESRGEDFEKGHQPLSLSNSERSSLEFLSPEPIPDEPPSAIGDSPIGMKTANSTPNNGLLETAQASGHEKSSSPTDELPIEDKSLTAEMIGAVAALDLDLPAVPELPPKPDPVNLEQYVDKDARKLAEKEAKRVQKVYAQAVKDREKAVKEREKIIEKRRKKQAQEAEKKAKEEEKKAREEEKRRKKGGAPAAPLLAAPTDIEQLPVPSDQASHIPAPEWRSVSPDPVAQQDKGKATNSRQSADKDRDEEKKMKLKQRKFCNVPKVHGRVDPKWVSVFMKDMDEVAAHTSLFFAGEHYEVLVGHVGNIVAEWVQADMTKRTVLGLR